MMSNIWTIQQKVPKATGTNCGVYNFRLRSTLSSSTLNLPEVLGDVCPLCASAGGKKR